MSADHQNSSLQIGDGVEERSLLRTLPWLLALLVTFTLAMWLRVPGSLGPIGLPR